MAATQHLQRLLPLEVAEAPERETPVIRLDHLEVQAAAVALGHLERLAAVLELLDRAQAAAQTVEAPLPPTPLVVAAAQLPRPVTDLALRVALVVLEQPQALLDRQ